MKNVYLKTLLSLSFALFIVFSSCKKDDESPKNPLIGTWVSFESETNDTYVSESTSTFVFNSNMTGDYSILVLHNDEVYFESEASFTYSFTATELTITIDSDSETIPYHIDGDDLHMDVEGNSSALIYTKSSN